MNSSERPQWASKIEYMLTTLGYSIGIGNLLRFPYICMSNGGGAFLIPYIIFLFLCGTPLFLAEITIGQFTSLSGIAVWNFASVFKGVGWCMIIISGFLSTYYVVLLGWVLYFLGSSFTWTLPWSHCNNPWNTDHCYSYSDIKNSNMSKESYLTNHTTSNNTEEWTSSAEEFYLIKMLNISPSINELGGINWPIFLCFVIAWVVSYLCMMNSTKTVGKVVYVTVLLPYILLTVFIIRGALLPGSLNGVKFYIIPKFKDLLTLQVWLTAAAQIFYSLGPAWGGLIVMASYNPFHANIIKRAMILPFICCLTSIYGGFAIFSIVGYMGHITNQTDLTQVINSGFGLGFVAYPQAMSLLPGSTIWSIMFFVTLFTLGIDSMFSTYETFLQGIIDQIPAIKGKMKHVFTVSCTLCLMLLGIPFTTRAGPYIYQIIDWYSCPIAIILIAITETIALCWFYNLNNLIKHIEMMMKSTLNKTTLFWIKGCFYAFTPLSLFGIFVGLIASFNEPHFNKTMVYPSWAVGMGWCFAVALMSPLFIVAVYEIIVHWPDWKAVFKPNETFKTIVANRLSLVKENERNVNSNGDRNENEFLMKKVFETDNIKVSDKPMKIEHVIDIEPALKNEQTNL